VVGYLFVWNPESKTYWTVPNNKILKHFTPDKEESKAKLNLNLKKKLSPDTYF